MIRGVVTRALPLSRPSIVASTARAAASSRAPIRTASSPTRASASSSSYETMDPDFKPAVIFFDCDDCLYKNDWKVANMLTHKIESFCGERLQMKEGYAYELYKKWGTCLRGMQQEGILTCPEMLEEYLEYSHDIPLHEHIGPDPELRAMLQSLDPSIPRWVFTASIEPHARRCLELLGVSDLFEGVIDVRAVDWVTKHDADAYHAAMKIANVTDPNRCLFLDDSTSNMRAAKKVGWRTVLVGEYGRDCGSKIECADADVTVGRVHELRDIAPGLFVEDAAPAGAAAV